MESLYVLEGAGEFIWSRLDGETSLDAIGAEVAASFDVELVDAQADVNEFISRLQEVGLIETEGAVHD